MGNAEDTGQARADLEPRLGALVHDLRGGGCEHNPDNPLSLFIQLGGKYQACRGEDICGQVVIDR